MSEWATPDNPYRREQYSEELITLSGQTLYNVCNEMVLRTHAILKKNGYLSPEEVVKLHDACQLAIQQGVQAETERIVTLLQRSRGSVWANQTDAEFTFKLTDAEWQELMQEPDSNQNDKNDDGGG